MVNSSSPRIRTLATVSASKRIPQFSWTDLAVIELHKALAGTGRAFLLGEVTEADGETRISLSDSQPFPASLRADHLMSVRDWQTLNEEIRRLAVEGLVGICRLTDTDTERGAAGDRKILEKYNVFGVRYVAEVDLEEVVRAVAAIAARPPVTMAPIEAPALPAVIEEEFLPEVAAEPKVSFALMATVVAPLAIDPVSEPISVPVAVPVERPESLPDSPLVAEVSPVISVDPIVPGVEAPVNKRTPSMAVAAGVAAVVACGLGIWTFGERPSPKAVPAVATPAPSSIVASPVAMPVAAPAPEPKATPVRGEVAATAPTAKIAARQAVPPKPVVAIEAKAKPAVPAATDAVDVQKAKREAALRALEQQ